MARKKPKTVLYRRKREGKTDYKKRLRLLLARQPRLVIRFTNKNIIAQLVNFSTSGDKVLVGINSYALKKQNWNYSCKNIPAAYLTGLLFGKKSLEKGQKKAILDTGFRNPLKKGRIYAFLKGVLDAGLEVPQGGKDIFPDEKRLSGKHIVDYADSLNGQEKYKLIFGQYLKNNNQPNKMTAVFEQIKQKLNK